MKVCWNVFTAQSKRRFISRHSCCNYLFTRGDFLRFYRDAIKKQHRRFVGSEKGKWSCRNESSVLVLIINSDTFSRYSSGHLRGSSRSRFPSVRITLLQRRREHASSFGNGANEAARSCGLARPPTEKNPQCHPSTTPVPLLKTHNIILTLYLWKKKRGVEGNGGSRRCSRLYIDVACARVQWSWEEEAPKLLHNVPIYLQSSTVIDKIWYLQLLHRPPAAAAPVRWRSLLQVPGSALGGVGSSYNAKMCGTIQTV